MPTPLFVAQSLVPKSTTSVKSQGQKATQTHNVVQPSEPQAAPLYLAAPVGLGLALMAVVVYGKIEIDKLKKKIRMEEFRTKEVQKKLKLALETIRKMEANPDLINSREFNLDYLRMRMAEDYFNGAIVQQVKAKVKDKISQALRPSQATIGIATTGRQVDEIFDVEYETGAPPKRTKRVLFRIQIRMMKLPTQATSATISQIINCIETYLSPADDDVPWQPTIQGRIVYMHWDQKAKPTPLLVLEQSNEGVNVTFRTSRQGGNLSDSQQIAVKKSAAQQTHERVKGTHPGMR